MTRYGVADVLYYRKNTKKETGKETARFFFLEGLLTPIQT